MVGLHRAGFVVAIALALFGARTPAGAQTAWPRITAVTPSGGQRGTVVEVTVTGVNVGLGTGLVFEGSGLTVEAVTPEPSTPPAKQGEKPAKSAGAPPQPKNATGKLAARVRIAPDAEPGIRAMRVLTPRGPSDVGWFVVGQWPEVAEREPNNTLAQAQEISLPATLNGRIDPAEESDVFRVHARAGQTLVFEVVASRTGSALDSILSLQDGTGRELALNEDFNDRDSLLAFTFPADDDYFLVLRDLRNQGSSNHTYRLSMGEIPYVTAAFPAGGKPGETVPMKLCGFNLGPTRSAHVTLPADAAPGLLPMTLALPAGVSNPITLAVADTPELIEVEPNDDAAQAQKVPVPATIDGRISPTRASAGPDADCYRFVAQKGQKLVLEVTARRCGSPLDSVLSILDAAGKELATNDDAVGKDSRLAFTAPATGEYLARVTDLQERGGPEYTYRLSIALAAPEFRLTFTPDRLAVGRGGRTALAVTAERLGDFEGEIAVEVAGLPKGVTVAGPSRIRAGQKSTILVLTAPPDAAIEASAFRVSGAATIDGKVVRHTAQGVEERTEDEEGAPHPAKLLTAAVTEPPDMVVSALPEKLTLARGGSAEVTVKIARKPGFTARVPLAVLGLPAGVSAGDDPSIPEKQTEAKVTLKAEAEATLGATEIVVTGSVVIDDRRQAPHAAAPITLTVGATPPRQMSSGIGS